MKYTLLVLFLLLLISCKKEENPGLQKYLQGKWELNRRWGANYHENLPAGNGNLLEFSAASFVRQFQNRQIQTGTYTLTPDTTSFNTHGTRITFVAADTTFSRFLITSDTAIVFWEYGSNGESTLYKRWK